MRNRRGADAALGAHYRDDAAETAGAWCYIELGEAAQQVQRSQRRDQILADAAAHQVAIELHVVDVADHDDLGAGVAAFR